MRDYGRETRDRQTLWDESTRPVAPSAPLGHTYAPHGQAVGQHLIDVHDHLRQELTKIHNVVAEVMDGALPIEQARSALNEMTIRQNNWVVGAYCASYCTTITQHHGIEDGSIFPHLRRADAGLVPVIDRLEQEHVIIHEVVQTLDRALVNLVRSGDDFSELRNAIDILSDALLSHLDYEEQQIVEPLSRYGFYAGQV